MHTTDYQSYDPTYFPVLMAIEDRHFWFRARNKVIAALLRQVTSHLSDGYRVLEIGCGTGNTLRVLDQICNRGLTLGMDLFAEGLHFAQQRTDCLLIQGDMHAPPFSKPFHIIALFDVLEHLPDDVGVLREVHHMLIPGGHIILTVPAYPSLWSYFDEASHHCRRYTLQELQNKLVCAGYRVEYATPFMMTLFPLVWIGRRLAARLQNNNNTPDSSQTYALATNELRIRPGINNILLTLLNLETYWISRQRRKLPFGTSLTIVASKV